MSFVINHHLESELVVVEEKKPRKSVEKPKKRKRHATEEGNCP